MITADTAKRVFVLEIAGLSTRYYSHVSPAGSNLDAEITAGIAYTEHQAISSVGAYTADIDPSGGVAHYGALSITLNINSINGGPNDPHVIFGRLSRSTDISTAFLTADLFRAATPASSGIDQDLTSLTYPRLMHIGAETVYCSSATATDLNISRRAVGNTPNQSHTLTLGGTNAPEITSEIISFRGRRAFLWCAQMRPDGGVSDYTQIMSGIIEHSPEISDGLCSLSIVPLTALVDNQISAKTYETHLVSGYHYFDGVSGSAIEYATQIAAREYFIEADLPLTVYGHDLAYQYDPTLPDGYDSTGLDGSSHPRFPLLSLIPDVSYVVPSALTPTTSGGIIDVTQITYTADSAATVMLGSRGILSTAERGELKQIEIPAGLQSWPAVINDRIDAIGPSTFSGLDGSVLKWRLYEGDQDKIIIETLTPSGSESNALVFFSSRWALERYLVFDRPTTDSDVSSAWLRWTDSGSSAPISNRQRLTYPIDVWGDDSPAPAEERGNPFEGSPQSIRVFSAPLGASHSTQKHIIDVARAYYQYGESRVIVEDSMGLPSSAGSDIFDLEVQFFDRAHDEPRTGYIRATHETQALDGAVVIGYYLHLHPTSDLINFGDWYGQERTRIIPASQFVDETAGEFLLKLLMSGGGQGVNGAYDVKSFGLNIPASMIDSDSFLQYATQYPFSLTSSLSADGVAVRDVVEPLLKSIGAALVMRRTEGGVMKIALQPVGIDRALDAQVTISDGNWLISPPPEWGVYEDLVTQVEIKYDFDPVQDQFMQVATFNNQEAINRYDGEMRKISLDLYGVSADDVGSGQGDAFNVFQPLVARVFNLLSNPLRLWRGRIGTGHSILTDIGAYAVCSSPHLKDYGPDYGVTSGVGMIRSIRQELMSEGCEVEIITTGAQVIGWNLSATVLSVLTSDSVQVSASAYSADDSTYYQSGQAVQYLPLNDHDSAGSVLTIQSVVGDVVTFTGAHSISVIGGTLESAVYAGADGYAYLASNATPPLINSDQAQEYS